MTDLFVRWQRGWGVARSLPPADDIGGGILRLRSGQIGRDVEYFAGDAGDPSSLARLVLGEDAPTWLTMPATDGTAAALEAAGLALLRRAEQLMTTDLRAHPRTTPNGPYRVRTDVEPGPYGTVLTAEVRHESGELAASGTMGLTGRDATADRILTRPAHRRHGLASAVMSALTRAATDEGATRGILVASEEGQRLYRALGWQPVTDILIASAPGNVYPETST